jgi:hypothetical protein
VNVRTMRKRHGYRKLAVSRRGQQKKKKKTAPEQGWVPEEVGGRPQRDDPPWRSGMVLRDAVMKDRRSNTGNGKSGQGTILYEYGTRKGRTFGWRRRAQPECNNDIRDQGAIRQLRLRNGTITGNGIRGQSRRQELRLGNVKTLYETLGQTLVLEVVKRTV